MAGVRSYLAGRAAVILIRSRITIVCEPEHGVHSGSAAGLRVGAVLRLYYGVHVCGFGLVLGLQQHRQYAVFFFVFFFLRDLKSYL